MLGFDEMFPTISECYYEEKPWQGIRFAYVGEPLVGQASATAELGHDTMCDK